MLIAVADSGEETAIDLIQMTDKGFITATVIPFDRIYLPLG